MLQDAEFLYRVELGMPVEGQDGVFRLSDYEIATRMSYFAWGSTPDETLLDLAESGALSDEDDRRDAMQTLLADDRARRQVDRFHALWLGYHELPHTPDLVYAMRTETAALLDRVVFDEPSSWLDLFTTTETYVDDTLAAHYGLSWPGWYRCAVGGLRRHRAAGHPVARCVFCPWPATPATRARPSAAS